MLSTIARNWWMLALRGLAAVIFGVAALVWPGPTLLVLVIAFGAFTLVDGVFTLISAIAWRKGIPRWWVEALAGLAGIVVGVLTFVWPAMTGLALLYMIAAWAIVTGILEIVAAIDLRRVLEGEWLLIIAGILTVVLGVLLVLFPGAGALSLAWLIGAYAIIAGIALIILAFQMRGWLKDAEQRQDQTSKDLPS